ncbi:DHS-like NAD/FAD-binding domain-containing protein [Aureobasidium subglaciale]|nr:DHS-like NAD/FAD-binding domain-containing protein [Aureobasidium subglaciale]
MAQQEQDRLQSWTNYCDNFSSHLQNSTSVLALLGAGLSASSGIQTYQANSTFHSHLVRDLSTKSRFERDPTLVWQCYRHRQAEILAAEPNAGHFALAALARVKEDFLAITQNVDDLSQRAGHSAELLVPIHGCLLDLCCTNTSCGYYISHQDQPSSLLPISSSPPPTCPLCTSPLRPAITRFGDSLPLSQTFLIESWFSRHEKVDLMLVVGCAATVSPAADYIDRAKEMGARIAVFNVSYEQQSLQLGAEDWFFEGDAGALLPLLLKKAIG